MKSIALVVDAVLGGDGIFIAATTANTEEILGPRCTGSAAAHRKFGSD